MQQWSKYEKRCFLHTPCGDVTSRTRTTVNISTVALPVIGGNKEEIQYLEVLGHPILGGYKYGNLAFQFGRV
jgi:hypothetical protein